MIILSALSAALAIVCAHVIASRLPGPGGTVSRFVVVAALGLVLYGTWAIRSYGLTADVVSSLLVPLFCCELYLFVITLSFASVSANVLTRLLSGPLSAESLGREYSGMAMSTGRAERLKQAGLVVAEADGLRLTMKGNVIVDAMSGLRRLFGHDRS